MKKQCGNLYEKSASEEAMDYDDFPKDSDGSAKVAYSRSRLETCRRSRQTGKLENRNSAGMKRVYELDVYKPAEELSDRVWYDFDPW